MRSPPSRARSTATLWRTSCSVPRISACSRWRDGRRESPCRFIPSHGRLLRSHALKDIFGIHLLASFVVSLMPPVLDRVLRVGRALLPAFGRPALPCSLSRQERLGLIFSAIDRCGANCPAW